MSLFEWQYIIDYYTATSPDTLNQPEIDHVTTVSDLFKIISPNEFFSNAATSYIKILDSSYTSRLLVCDAGIGDIESKIACLIFHQM